ncbi:MAG TPA: ABC transporter substrate-binding protein [Pseudolabrys sp.]|jgi:branched-chain amino acid transport system substrate-binding protein|nr:ABC transporter substrate-binding protein [Pseudolabrys sp.]
MSLRVNRRKFLAGTAAAAGAASFPMPSIAQNAPIKVGLLTVKTGPLAAGGQHAEEGITAFLREKNFKLSGRKIELTVADTGGSPAGAKTKAQELVEREKVNVVLGPFAAFELLATLDYLEQAKMPTLAFAGAEDVTQRKRNNYLTRTSYTSAQCLYPLGDYVATEMKLKSAATIADDFAFGYEQIGGFQRVLEEEGGRVLKKLWSPLKTADYAPYVAQIPNCDVVCVGLAGSNPIKFIKQAKALGVKQHLIGGSTTADDTIISAYGEEAEGLINTNPYSLDIDSDANHRFIAALRKYYGKDVHIGHYAACFYIDGQVIEAALAKTGGKADDPDQFVKAIRSVTLAETPRGPISFDDYGQVIIDVYVRRVEKHGSKMVNKTIKTYHKVSQFWKMDPKEFLSKPVFSRDYPPMKS